MTTATVDEFDTHLFVKDMTHEGMPERQAEKLASHIQKHQNRLVTREYFRDHLDKCLAEQDARMTLRILWICGGMVGGGVTILGWMMQSMLGGG